MRKVPPTKQILVYVDDDEDDLQLVEDAMFPYMDSIELCLFQSGTAAYSFLMDMENSGLKPCVIILDMNMPRLGARELLPVLRSMSFFEDVPVILFTTSSMQHDYHFALQHNAGFITKPMTYKQMDVIAEEFLSHCSDEVKAKIKRTDNR